MSATCVALVDDEAPVRVALGRLLRLGGHEVSAFASGEEFLEHMPGMTGLQVQARLRAMGLALPVIFITASDDAEIARRALEAGGLLVLHKPFSNELLLDAVNLALKQRPRPGV
ncbi:MAG: response regulator [Burkholderiaceae bacterium]|nr:response regulator [Burkholderiaceae bacterium]